VLEFAARPQGCCFSSPRGCHLCLRNTSCVCLRALAANLKGTCAVTAALWPSLCTVSIPSIPESAHNVLQPKQAHLCAWPLCISSVSLSKRTVHAQPTLHLLVSKSACCFNAAFAVSIQAWPSVHSCSSTQTMSMYTSGMLCLTSANSLVTLTQTIPCS